MTPESTTHERLDLWALVELFGHQKIAGKVSEQQLAGGTFLRVDVPEIDGTPHFPGTPAFTRFYGTGAIYALSPCSEEVARKVACQLRINPISVYVPELRQLPAGATAEPASIVDDPDDDGYEDLDDGNDDDDYEKRVRA